MIGPMQIAYIVWIVLGFLQLISTGNAETPIDAQKQETQGGTIFWIGLISLIVSVLVKTFG